MNLQEKDLKYIWHPCSQMKDYEELPPIIIEKAKGIYIYDNYGNKYIDIISSWWCNLLGHCNPKINEAIKKQIDKLEHVIFANFSHKPAITLCEKLSSILPNELTKFIFSDNGSSSIECALKLSYQYQYQIGKTKKKKFMCFKDGYHGETIGALSVGNIDLYKKIYKPILIDVIDIEAPDCYRCKYEKNRENCQCECFEKTEKSFESYADETAAIIIEPLLQGSAGMKIYPPLYIKKLREICDKYNVLLILDEIATGFGRTGKMFAIDYCNIVPDIICLSKGLTGGYLPMALTITNNKIYDVFYDEYLSGKAFLHSHTYSGNPLACTAAIAVQDILKEDNIIENANKNAIYLKNNLNDILLKNKNVGEIRSIGLINAIEIVKDKNNKIDFEKNLRIGYQIYKEALKNGLLLRPLGNVLYFNPPLNISRKEIDLSIEKCVKSINNILK